MTEAAATTASGGAGGEGATADPREDVRDEVWRGLTAEPRVLSSRWFYDERGSKLFEAITRLPEYYPTRTEQALLDRWAGPWMSRIRPRSLVELGAGSARKTRTLLDAMVAERPGGRYLPLDVSAEFLHETARAVQAEYPGLLVQPHVADLSGPLTVGDAPGPAVWAFLGSTIGNFSPAEASVILRNLRRELRNGDALVLGADLRPGPGKPGATLAAAYDDPGGVTAAFNRNILRVLNRAAGTDFEPKAFRHLAFYSSAEGRIEMHLVARSAQTVRVPERGEVHLVRGDRIRTEISCKYDRATIDGLFERAGLSVVEWVTDRANRYALILAEPC